MIRTDPPAGSQVDDGTTVNIVLRNLQAIVPDLTGDTVTEAMAALTAVGLVLDTVFGTDVNTLVQGATTTACIRRAWPRARRWTTGPWCG